MHSGTPIALRDDRRSPASRDIRLISSPVLGVFAVIAAVPSLGEDTLSAVVSSL
jgi:hypothetical protein